MSYSLHAVIVKKPNKTLEEAQTIAKHFIKNKKYYRETKSSYRFRNHPKEEFIPGSFKTKKLNKDVSLIFGTHKDGKDELVEGGAFVDDMLDKLTNFFLKYNPLSIGVKHAISQAQEKHHSKK
jgi:hypothetical protein